MIGGSPFPQSGATPRLRCSSYCSGTTKRVPGNRIQIRPFRDRASYIDQPRRHLRGICSAADGAKKLSVEAKSRFAERRFPA
jgi:hypothetical protein